MPCCPVSTRHVSEQLLVPPCTHTEQQKCLPASGTSVIVQHGHPDPPCSWLMSAMCLGGLLNRCLHICTMVSSQTALSRVFITFFLQSAACSPAIDSLGLLPPNFVVVAICSLITIDRLIRGAVHQHQCVVGTCSLITID